MPSTGAPTAPRDEPDAAPVKQIRTLTWGLVPSWSKEAKLGRLINARSESVTERPSFRAAASKRRCLLPADGYFEWEKRDDKKIPHFLHGDGVLAMAGLYELWRDRALPEDDPNAWLWTATILTRSATDALGRIHDRCPVVLPATPGALARPVSHRQRRRPSPVGVGARSGPADLGGQHRGEFPPQQWTGPADTRGVAPQLG